MGLLIVQVLDAMLNGTQKQVSLTQCSRRGLRHQPRLGQAFKRRHGGPGAQFRVLPAAHHLQQLHDELDFANASTRELHIMRTFGPACAAPSGVFADLAVQHTQRIEHVVVQIASKHKGQHHVTQSQRAAVSHAVKRGNHAALKPRKPLPLAALHVEVFFQRAQAHGGWARVAIGPQRKVQPEHKAMFGRLPNQAVNRAYTLGKIFLVGNAASTLRIACRFTVGLKHVDQVNVAGDIQLAPTQLAHANHPQWRALAVWPQGFSMNLI